MSWEMEMELDRIFALKGEERDEALGKMALGILNNSYTERIQSSFMTLYERVLARDYDDLPGFVSHALKSGRDIKGAIKNLHGELTKTNLAEHYMGELVAFGLKSVGDEFEARLRDHILVDVGYKINGEDYQSIFEE